MPTNVFDLIDRGTEVNVKNICRSCTYQDLQDINIWQLDLPQLITQNWYEIFHSQWLQSGSDEKIITTKYCNVGCIRIVMAFFIY